MHYCNRRGSGAGYGSLENYDCSNLMLIHHGMGLIISLVVFKTYIKWLAGGRQINNILELLT